MDGITLVEVVVATSVSLIVLISLFAAHSSYLKTAFATGSAVKASYLAEEGLEAIRFLRDSSWTTNIAPLNVGSNYYLTFSLGTWSVGTVNVFIDSVFERQFVLSDVYRDSSFRIVSSGGTLDPQTKKVTVNVSWKKGVATTTKTISTYITNLWDN